MSKISSLEFLILFLTSFLIASLLTPLMRKLALSIGFIDKPNSEHKTHKVPVPYLGGAAIVIATLVTVYAPLIVRSETKELLLVSTILGPAVVLSIIGLADDWRSLKPSSRFLVQSISGLVVASLVVFSNSSGNPTGNRALDLTISVIWIVGITNALNFFDNIDGGSAGIVSISSLAILMIAIDNGQFLVAAGSTVLVGATLGFIFWNIAPAKIYMGDTGALFLGFLLSVITIRLDPGIKSLGLSLSIPLLLLAIPILDTTVAVSSRLRRQISPVKGGRDHLSHRLMRFGFSKQKSVYTLWFLQIFFAASAICISRSIPYSGLMMISATLFWITLFVLFLKIPDQD